MIRALFILFLAVLLGAAPRPAMANTKPELLVFAVGVSKYTRDGPQSLNYAAKDARDIVDALRSVATVREDSVVLLAEEDSSAADLERVTAQGLRDEIANFANRITEDGTNVVVYLGGHGTMSLDDSTLWFLPYDYKAEAAQRFVPVYEFLDAINQRVNATARPLRNVHVTFIVNICGAGSAATMHQGQRMSTEDQSEVKELARKLHTDAAFGDLSLAVIPASPAGSDTFEKPEYQRSVFAHHFLEGLSGRADFIGDGSGVDGQLTVGELHSYVAQGLRNDNLLKDTQDLPRNGKFNDDHLIGITSPAEGALRLKLGTALMGAARVVEASAVEGGNNSLSPAGGELAATREMIMGMFPDEVPPARVQEDSQTGDRGALFTMLRERAAGTLRHGRNMAPELADRVRLREAMLAGRGGKITLPQRLTKPGNDLSDSERQLVTDLTAAGPFDSPAAFHRHLAEADKSYLLWIASYPSHLATLFDFDAPSGFSGDPLFIQDGIPVSQPMADLALLANPAFVEHVTQSRKRLKSAFDTVDIVVVPRLYEGVLNRFFFENLDRITNPDHQLVIAYSGNADLKDEDCDEDCVLYPLGKTDLRLLAREASRPFLFVYSAPFGGIFKQDKPDHVALLLSAGQRNGMTFATIPTKVEDEGVRWLFTDSTPFVNVLTGEASLDVAYADYFAKIANFNIRAPDLGGDVIGRPEWVPPDSELDEFLLATEDRLANLAPLVTADCLDQPLKTCEEIARSIAAAGGEAAAAPLAAMGEAAAHDIARQLDDAAPRYAGAAQGLRNIAAHLREVGRDTPSFAAPRTIEALADLLARRGAAMADDAATGRVVILPFAVEAYDSPLIPPVPGAAIDARNYVAIADRLRGRAEETAILTPRARDEMLGTIRDTVKDLAPDDLLILAYSGRGLTLNGEPYLALPPVDFAFLEFLPGVDVALSPEERGGLVSLDEIAQAIGERNALAIYDTQFTLDDNDLEFPPFDLAMRKHVDPHGIIWPRNRTPVDGEDERPALRRINQGTVPAGQLHLWVDSPLTQRTHPFFMSIPDDLQPTTRSSTELPAETLDTGSSPIRVTTIPSHSFLVASFLRALMTAPPPRDYPAWLERTANSDDLQMRFAAQGDLDRPVGARGPASEALTVLRNGALERWAHLSASHALARRLATRFPGPAEKLTEAVTLFALETLREEQPQLLRIDFVSKSLARASTRLDQVLRGLERTPPADEADLALLREITARRHLMTGRPADAQAVLQRDDALLARRGLAWLLARATEDTVRTQPLSILLENRRRLARAAPGKKEALTRLDTLIAQERARLNEPPRIGGGRR